MALSRQARTVFALTAPAYLWLAVTVLLPLAAGMAVRGRWPGEAGRLRPAVGVV